MADPSLSTAARGVLDEAIRVVADALDQVRPGLLAASGEVDVAAKADGTPVTDTDREVDDHLAARLLEAFPGHGLLSEERATTSPDTEWTWIVDPIDGTSNFVCRLPYWCVSIALALEGQPVLGVVDAPVLGRRYIARLGEGAVLEGRSPTPDGTVRRQTRRPLRVRPGIDWRDPANRHVPVMLTTSTARAARAAGLRLNPRVMGSTALDMAVVAEGVAAASIALVPKVWDVAAGMLLVREAGGAVTHLEHPSLFPVVPGVQYRDRSVVTVAGPEAGYVAGLAEALLAAR